ACARINPGARRAGVLSPEAQRHDDDRPTAGSNSKTSPASHGLTKVCTDSLLEEGGFEPSVPPWGQDLPTPARRRLRCQSRASSSSASFGVFCPSKPSDIALRSEISSASHTGCAGVGNPVSIASAATGGQPSFATIVGSRSTEPRGGALPRSMELSIHLWSHFQRGQRFRHSVSRSTAPAASVLISENDDFAFPAAKVTSLAKARASC